LGHVLKPVHRSTHGSFVQKIRDNASKSALIGVIARDPGSAASVDGARGAADHGGRTAWRGPDGVFAKQPHAQSGSPPKTPISPRYGGKSKTRHYI
jgi:hypothetical protein